jgi:branched-chain amino acid transport system ATP-binding protein
MTSTDSVAWSPDVESGGHAAPVLNVHDLVCRFGGVTAVNGVNFSLGGDERLAVIGPNGAGKTTLFRLIAGDMRPTEGRVVLFGNDVTRLPNYKRARLGVSRTFQVSTLFSNLSVIDNVRVGAQASSRVRHRFWWPQGRHDGVTSRSDEALEQVGLLDRRHDVVRDLSHGEQRQLEIAIALATRPKFLLLDEPAAGLALAERMMLRNLLKNLPRSLPLLLIEHDMSLVLEFADRVLCLANGHQIALGTPDEIRADVAVQKAYLGGGNNGPADS